MTDRATGEASLPTVDPAAVETPEAAEPSLHEAAAAEATTAAIEEPIEPAVAESAGHVESDSVDPDAAEDEPVDEPLVASEAESEVAVAAAGAGETGSEAEAEGDAEAAGEEDGGPGVEPESTAFFKQAKSDRRTLAGKVIGWNKGGFHVVIEDQPAFCPRSEIELGEAGDPESYIDRDFAFQVLRVESKGRRVVVSRAAALRSSRTQQARETLTRVEVGSVVRGRVASLVEFGAFVDLGGVKGLVHISEISHRQVRKAEDVLQLGQEVEVKVLKVQNGGKRISLSMKALEPDPWQGVSERYKEGQQVDGVIERTNRYGAFISLEPGLTGLLPMSEMNLPRGANAERSFPPGKKIQVQVLSVSPGQKRISLGLEGSRVEGSSADFKAFKTRQEEASGFNSLAAAFQKLK